MDKKEVMAEIIRRLKKEYPVLKSALNFSGPFELLAATILSAQTTDVHVNKVTDTLFKKYKSVKDFANADPAAFEKDVSSVNFYRNKARNIQNAARIIIEKSNGEVPRTMDDLVSLPAIVDELKASEELAAADDQLDPEVAAAFAEEIAKLSDSLTRVNQQLVELVKVETRRAPPEDENKPKKLSDAQKEDVFNAIQPQEVN